MARIKINELRPDVMISKEEMKKVFGGLTIGTTTTLQSTPLSALEPDPWTGRITDSSLSVSTDPIGTKLIKLNSGL